MASMTFQINDASTGGVNPAVWVTVNENADGTLSFSVSQQGGIIGDLRGLFFDLNDESIAGSLKVTSNLAPTQVQQGNDSVRDLGNGANMNGLLGSTAENKKVAGAEGNGYDVGIEIGTSGIGKDDIRSYDFTLSSTTRKLTLQDFANVDFGVRLTSVGTLGGNRDDSSKLLEKTSSVIDALDDSASVIENNSTSGNVLTNDKAGLPAGDAVSVTSWSGGALGAVVVLFNAEGATLQLNSNGSYILDASAADKLSAGESLTYNFTYNAKSGNEATSWSTDSAKFNVTVNGVNDGPVAGNDNASTSENTSVSGSVLGNDTDIDRLDTLRVTAVNGVTDGAFGDLDGGLGSIRVALASGAIVIMKSDGSFTYDTKGAFAALNTGQSATDSFEYTLADNHGGTDIALVSLRVDGVSDVIDPPPSFLFNHGSGKNDHGFFPKTEDKVNWVAGFTGNDTLKIAGYGDAKSVTFSTGDFNYGDPSIADTKFVIWIDGNNTSTRTEDVGYLADYTGLVAGQVNVTGDAPPPVELFFV